MMKRSYNKSRIIQLTTCCAVVAAASSIQQHQLCFVQPSSYGKQIGASATNINHNLFGQASVLTQKRQRSSFHRHHMSRDNQEVDENYNYDDDDDDDDDYDEIKSNLNKISWLPSVKLGKQPYRPKSESRRESDDKDRYEAAASSSTPPGFESIDILPVLPMTMVHGLDRLLDGVDDDDDDDDIESISEEISSMSYTGGVWEEEDLEEVGLSSMTSSFGPIFSGTASFLPHTKGHVFTIAEPRYKKLYDDLLRMGSYYGKKRESAIRFVG